MIKQPKYKFGDKVLVEVASESFVGKLQFKNKIALFIRDICMESTEHDITYRYGLTKDLPAAYYSGLASVLKIEEKDILGVDSL